MSTPNSTAYINSQWLLPRHGGMVCQPHSRVLGMFVVYNIVSIALSVLIALPFIYNPTKRATDGIGALFKRAFLALICKTGYGRVDRNPDSAVEVARPAERDTVAVERDSADESRDSADESQTSKESPTSIIIGVIGSIALTISGPVWVGLSIRYRHGHATNIWALVQQWSTRPRATFFITLIHEIIEYRRLKRPGESTKGSGHILLVVSSLCGEVILNIFSMNYVVKQNNRPPETVYSSRELALLNACRESAKKQGLTNYKCTNGAPGVRRSVMQHGVLMALVVNCINIGFFVIYWFTVCCIWSLIRRTDKREKKPPTLRFAMLSQVEVTNRVLLCFMSLPILLIYIAHWLIWGGLLTTVPIDMYCIEQNLYIDLIYCILPVALGLWRVAWSPNVRDG